MSRSYPLLFLIPLLLGFPPRLTGQVIPDTIPPPDTLRAEPNLPDSLAQEAQADTINPADTLPAVRLPPLARALPAGWETGVWAWDREAILGSKAVTLLELLREVPGVIMLRGGDFGMPSAASAFGAGGGRIRVFRDGIEMLPLEGSVADLSRIGLGGLREVRVERGVGELRIHLESVLAEGGRPYSLIEAGTGDLNTNVFRGTFAHPRALGGVVSLAMDRVDTQGPRGREPGSASGGWIRYARPLWGGGALVLDYHSKAENRGDLYAPPKASRKDWSVRVRWPLPAGIVGDLSHGSSSLRAEAPDTFPFQRDTRTQTTLSLSHVDTHLRSRLDLRKLSGRGLPSSTIHFEASATLPSVGGVAGSWDRESWEGRATSRKAVQAWTAPVYGFSLFAERRSGEWGTPFLPAKEVAPPDSVAEGGESPPAEPSGRVGPSFSSMTGTRLGGRFEWRGLALEAARVRITADSLFPIGLPFDRDGAALPGGSRSGLELSVRIPLLPRGMSLVGSVQRWDQEEDVWATPEDSASSAEPLPEDAIPWRYLPRHNYQGSFSFHNTFLPTGNLEVWFDLGVKGRDPMVVPFQEEVAVADTTRLVPTMVPFEQSWFIRLQIRVVTVRVFFMWENFTTRQRNQDFPGRVLPATRSIYGVRWTMWN